MATLIEMCRDLAERLYRESHWPVTGSATGGDTTSLIDTTELLYSSGDPNAWDRKWVYRETTPSDTVTSSRVTEAGFSGSAGDLTLSPALSSSFASGNNYLITDHHIDVLKNAINRIQGSIFLPTFWPLSMHIVANDNNDMEGSGLDGDYSKTNATLATESAIVFNGAQSLKITASATAGYANTGNIGVNDGQQLNAAVMMYVTSGDSGTFRVVDVTNSVTIHDAKTDEPSWMELYYSFSASGEQIDFRFIADANTDVIYVDDFQVWRQDGGVYALPSWITRPEQLLDVRGFPQGTGGPTSGDDYRSNERRSAGLEWGFERIDRRGKQPLHIWVRGTSLRPFIYALRPLDALTADTSTSVAEQDFVVRWAEKLIRDPEHAADTMALLRAVAFGGVNVTPSRRAGVAM